MPVSRSHPRPVSEDTKHSGRHTACEGPINTPITRGGDVYSLGADSTWASIWSLRPTPSPLGTRRRRLGREAAGLEARVGILSSRELIGASVFFEPDLDTFGEVWTTFLQLLKANGGHPQMGKALTRMFLKAGFSDIHASASFDSYSTTGDIDVLHGVANGWFFSPETVAAATKHGLARHEQFDAWRRMLDPWKDTPGHSPPSPGERRSDASRRLSCVGRCGEVPCSSGGEDEPQGGEEPGRSSVSTG